MALIKSPLPDLQQMQQAMDQTLDRHQDAATSAEPPRWQPPVDIWETDQELVLLMDLPGVDQQQIDVQIDDHVLVVQGQRTLDARDDADMQRQERPVGVFERRFSLPDTVEVGRVRASCEQGVLTIRLPKVDGQQVMHVTVEALD